MEGTLALAERLAALDAAGAALEGLDTRLWESASDQLGPLVQRLDRLGLLVQAGQIAATTEAVERGVCGSRQSWVAGWLLQWAPSLRAGGAKAMSQVALAFGKPANAPVREAVLAGQLPSRSAASALAEADRLRPRLADGAEPHVMVGLVEQACLQGPAGPRALRAALLARYGLDGELQAEQDDTKAHVVLSQPYGTEFGTFEYRMTLDVEGKEVLEAALGPLAAPRPAQGASDLRNSDQRRGDALVELVRRAVASAPGIPAAAKTTLFVTMDYAALVAQSGAGMSVGGTGTGTLLAPGTVRRLACDGSVVPVVLGGQGEILDLGREHRLFSSAQHRALWLRDRGCTFPGCPAPPHWADGHHLVHWADGGSSDLGNAALLCGRHHTLVHQRGYYGEVTPDGVQWDTTPGAYDHYLAHGRPPPTDDRPPPSLNGDSGTASGGPPRPSWP